MPAEANQRTGFRSRTASAATIRLSPILTVVDCTDGLCTSVTMPSKTISLEVDAYHRLKATRRAGESFSEVVRRITLPPARATAADLLAEVKAGGLGRGVDWRAVQRAGAGRRRSRELRPA